VPVPRRQSCPLVKLKGTPEVRARLGLSDATLVRWIQDGIVRPEQPARGSGTIVGLSPVDVAVIEAVTEVWRSMGASSGSSSPVGRSVLRLVADGIYSDPEAPWVLVSAPGAVVTARSAEEVVERILTWRGMTTVIPIGAGKPPATVGDMEQGPTPTSIEGRPPLQDLQEALRGPETEEEEVPGTGRPGDCSAGVSGN